MIESPTVRTSVRQPIFPIEVFSLNMSPLFDTKIGRSGGFWQMGEVWGGPQPRFREQNAIVHAGLGGVTMTVEEVVIAQAVAVNSLAGVLGSGRQ